MPIGLYFTLDVQACPLFGLRDPGNSVFRARDFERTGFLRYHMGLDKDEEEHPLWSHDSGLSLCKIRRRRAGLSRRV